MALRWRVSRRISWTVFF